MELGGHAEATAWGASLGEAKWRALKELQERFPGLTADYVQFTELEGGAGGSSDVGIVARADLQTWQRQEREVPESPAERVRALVERVVAGLGVRGSVEVTENDQAITATVNGSDLGLLIGKRGHTVDAIEHLAVRAAFARSSTRKQVGVDIAGYRKRRQGALERAASRAADDAIAFGRAVSLDPMSASERKAIHLFLRERDDVETYSEGQEPERRLVVVPRGHTAR